MSRLMSRGSAHAGCEWAPECESGHRAKFTCLCRPHHSQSQGTDSSAKKCLVMDADDEAVLSLIAECEWDLSNPPGA